MKTMAERFDEWLAAVGIEVADEVHFIDRLVEFKTEMRARIQPHVDALQAEGLTVSMGNLNWYSRWTCLSAGVKFPDRSRIILTLEPPMGNNCRLGNVVIDPDLERGEMFLSRAVQTPKPAVP